MYLVSARHLKILLFSPVGQLEKCGLEGDSLLVELVSG